MNSDQRTRVEGDVLRYVPSGGMHAREGRAVVRADGRAVDTYWRVEGDSGSHWLREDELATAEHLFNLADYRCLGPTWEAGKAHAEWETYAPEDRQVITSQHGLQQVYYVRVGAEPDLATQIANAERRVREAEGEVEAAQRRLKWRRADLAALNGAGSDQEGT